MSRLSSCTFLFSVLHDLLNGLPYILLSFGAGQSPLVTSGYDWCFHWNHWLLPSCCALRLLLSICMCVCVCVCVCCVFVCLCVSVCVLAYTKKKKIFFFFFKIKYSFFMAIFIKNQKNLSFPLHQSYCFVLKQALESSPTVWIATAKALMLALSLRMFKV